MSNKFQLGRCTVKINREEYPSDPREDSNLGTMVCWHRNYKLGDEQPKEDAGEYLLHLARKVVAPKYPEVLLIKNRDTLLAKHYCFLPVAMIDHSGLSFYVGGTVIGESVGHPRGHAVSDSAGWDSGQIGFIYVGLPKALEWQQIHPVENQGWDTPIKHLSGEKQVVTLREFAEGILRDEVDAYDKYQTGQIFEYRVTSLNPDYQDSCGGYFDEDDCEADARSAASALDRDLAALETETAMAEVYP
jgi:hypothetical protein